jgi:predicted SAM-dependent methyltransferase
MGIKLDIGSGNPAEGEIRPQGYTLNDVCPHEGIDIVCNILDLDKHLEPGSCSEIRASHVLEHFSRKELDTVFSMVYNLLEDSGSFLIMVPNFMWHAQLLIEGKDEDAVTYAYGGQLDEYDFHKTGFTVRTLQSLLEKHGFKVVTMLERASIRCMAVKWILK